MSEIGPIVVGIILSALFLFGIYIAHIRREREFDKKAEEAARLWKQSRENINRATINQISKEVGERKGEILEVKAKLLTKEAILRELEKEES